MQDPAARQSRDLQDLQWDALTTLLLQFEAGWREAPYPELGEFLPEGDSTTRIEALVELIKIDQEYRLRRGELRQVERYLSDWPELQDDTDSVADLLQAECLTRAMQSDLPDGAELRSRFPELASRVDLAAVAAEYEHERSRIANRETIVYEQAAVDTSPIPAGILAPPQRPDEIGRIGDYRVLEVLGAGGMGVVFLADDERLGRRVAIKTLKGNLASSVEFRKRFLREARAAARLNHDHVVTIHQVGDANGVPFLAMPLLEGETLETRLQRKRILPVAEVIRVGREVTEALVAAHNSGLVHRDIKPSNIWLEHGTDRSKLLDFGLAGIVTPGGEDAPLAGDDRREPHREADAQLTRPDDRMGTPAYMAPEQLLGETTDTRSDLFSLGCVLYRMVTSELPPVELATSPTVPVPPQTLNPAVPKELNGLILQLLAKRPQDRPSDSSVVLDQLQQLENVQGRRTRQMRWITGSAAAILLLVIVAGLASVALRPPSPNDSLPRSAAALPAVVLPPRFDRIAQYRTGIQPFYVVAEDFNGDGDQDLVVSDMTSDTLTFFYGRGDGSFDDATARGVGDGPHTIALGDFNEDQVVDISVALMEEDAIGILLGKQDGTFDRIGPLQVGAAPRGLTASDLDGDGHLDLVSSNTLSDDITVWFGAGDATFHSVVNYAVGRFPVSVVAADLNQDQSLDLLASNGNSDTVSVLLGSATREFRPAVSVGVGSGPGMLGLADFNTDGHIDVAIENFGSDDVTVLFGDGTGGFGNGGTHAVGSGPGGIAVGDFNGDGVADLLVANHKSHDVSLLIGHPDGTFATAIHYRVGSTPVGIAVADFDADGRVDFAVANHWSADVSVRLNSAPGPYFRVAMSQFGTARHGSKFVVTAMDREGRTIRNFRGTIHFHCSDPTVLLPAPYTFTAADKGTHILLVPLGESGAVALSVSCDQPQAFGGNVILLE